MQKTCVIIEAYVNNNILQLMYAFPSLRPMVTGSYILVGSIPFITEHERSLCHDENYDITDGNQRKISQAINQSNTF